MRETNVKLFVNAEDEETYRLVDDWIGRTAPEEVDSFQIRFEPRIGELEVYLTNELSTSINTAEWNLNKGFITEAYGWECKVVFVSSMAADFRLNELANYADQERIRLRDLRENAQRNAQGETNDQ